MYSMGYISGRYGERLLGLDLGLEDSHTELLPIFAYNTISNNSASSAYFGSITSNDWQAPENYKKLQDSHQ